MNTMVSYNFYSNSELSKKLLLTMKKNCLCGKNAKMSISFNKLMIFPSRIKKKACFSNFSHNGKKFYFKMWISATGRIFYQVKHILFINLFFQVIRIFKISFQKFYIYLRISLFFQYEIF